MVVLDENIPAGQRDLLRKQRIRFRLVGVDTADFGTSDEDLIPMLHRLPKPTFFTLDAGFFRPSMVHTGYALVHLDLSDDQTAEFIGRFLKHPLLCTKKLRMGTVARIRQTGIHFWRKGAHRAAACRLEVNRLRSVQSHP